jgi:hypothetical protein
MDTEIDRLIHEAVRVESLEDIQRLPPQTESVHLDILDDGRAEALGRIPALRAILHDGNSLLTDHGLAALANLRNLEALSLEWSHLITDRGLESLIDLPRLRYLDISFCDAISEQAVDRLKRALPSCEVDF